MPLSAPVTAVAVERSEGRLGRAAVAAMQGVRVNFEDAHFLDHSHGCCGVYDGHLGDEAAAFCAERLHQHVQAAGEPSVNSLLEAFSSCDTEMRGALPQGSESGSTATLAMVREDGGPDKLQVWVASCGDSRAILWRRDGGSIEATRDHRPCDDSEKRRIEAAGGFVSEEFDQYRVDGQLACSRALGAFKFKQDEALAASAQKVSSEPEVYQWSAQRGDWLILACDGVWDTFSNERVVQEVCKTDSGTDIGTTLAQTLQLCIDKDADDNLTLMAIELGTLPEVAHSLQVTPGNYLKTKDKEVFGQYEEFCLKFGYSLKKEMVPKAPPKAALSEASPVPGPRFAALPALQPHLQAAAGTAGAAERGSGTPSARPGLLEMKITAQRNSAFYVHAARQLMRDTEEELAPSELVVQALGNAIPVVASVVLAMSEDGHEVVSITTDMVEVLWSPKQPKKKESQRKQQKQTPRLTIVVKHA